MKEIKTNKFYILSETGYRYNKYGYEASFYTLMIYNNGKTDYIMMKDDTDLTYDIRLILDNIGYFQLYLSCNKGFIKKKDEFGKPVSFREVVSLLKTEEFAWIYE